MRTLAKIALGALAVGITGAIFYSGYQSGVVADQLLETYKKLPPKDRFVGMLYLTAEADGQPLPAEELSQLAKGQNPAALLAMELFTKTSQADRRTFIDLAFNEMSPAERLFTLKDVRKVRAQLDKGKIPYSSDVAINVLRNDYPDLAIDLGLGRGRA